MYRILLISDTRGNLDAIDEKAEQFQADLVIYTGDFNFYNNDSVKRLSHRELRLLISHSPI